VPIASFTESSSSLASDRSRLTPAPGRTAAPVVLSVPRGTAGRARKRAGFPKQYD